MAPDSNHTSRPVDVAYIHSGSLPRPLRSSPFGLRYFAARFALLLLGLQAEKDLKLLLTKWDKHFKSVPTTLDVTPAIWSRWR